MFNKNGTSIYGSHDHFIFLMVLRDNSIGKVLPKKKKKRIKVLYA